MIHLHSALWTEKNAPQSLHTLMAQLIVQREATGTVLPAIVDATTWNTLHLAIGKNFIISLEQPGSSLDLTCRAIAEVDSLPSSDAAFPSGVLVDYQTYMKSVQAPGVLISSARSNFFCQYGLVTNAK